MQPPENLIQRIIAALDTGAGHRLLRALILLAVIGALFGVYAVSQFRGLRLADAMDAAQLGRSLARGRGFTTQCLRPVDAHYLDPARPAAAGRPELRRGPVYPAVLAAGFALARPSFAVDPGSPRYAPEWTVILPLGFLCTAGAGLLLYLLARRCFDGRTALTAVAVYFLSERVLCDAAGGTALPLLSFLACAALYLAVRALRRPPGGDTPRVAWAPLLLAGTAAGLAFLTRYSMAVLPAAAALYCAARLPRGRLSAAGALAGVALLIAAPWLWRNAALTGNPLGLAPQAALADSVLYAEDGFDRDPAPQLDPPRVIRAARYKLVNQLAPVLDRRLRTLGNGLVMAFFLVALLHRFENRDADTLRWCVVLALLLLVPAAALSESGGVAMRAFLPLIILFGTAYFFVVLERLELFDPGWEVILTWSFVAIAALPLLLRLGGATPTAPYPPYFPPYAAYAAAQLEPDETLCTDIPWATAWYGDRPSVLAPAGPDGMAALQASRLQIGGIYLTQRTRRSTGPAGTAWGPVLNGRLPPDFVFTNAVLLPPGRGDQVLLTD
ncbi:MAG: glycosyltransferase family 39 protein [Lentisphaerae bacterium]|nr:glycosyltransferase family 39 protein [Lentisphaerota bacterium]